MDLAFRTQTILQIAMLSNRHGITAAFDPAKRSIIIQLQSGMKSKPVFQSRIRECGPPCRSMILRLDCGFMPAGRETGEAIRRQVRPRAA